MGPWMLYGSVGHGGGLWRNISGRKIIHERTDRNAQVRYLSVRYSDCGVDKNASQRNKTSRYN